MIGSEMRRGSRISPIFSSALFDLTIDKVVSSAVT